MPAAPLRQLPWARLTLAAVGTALYAATGLISWSTTSESFPGPGIAYRWITIGSGGFELVEASFDVLFVNEYVPDDWPPPPGFARSDSTWRWWYTRATNTPLYARLIIIPLWPAALLPVIPATTQLVRVARRRRNGLCPNCAYSLSGLATKINCPECGERYY